VDRPEIFPVNYTFDGGAVVFRTGHGTKLDWSIMGHVAFEVDEIDPVSREGWVVEVKGMGRDLTTGGDERSLRARSLTLAPWVAGEHDTWIAVVPSEISGRRLLKDANAPST
jgi:uncharacterized protein